ncbi:MAG TPA: hypothetical protein VKW78_12930 [Terriglobales bacterium]|jgi:uncharacterized membrane protein|nr:hypothetical protein [Terriglobales bacterium]
MNTDACSVLVGVIAGMRSSSAPMIVSRIRARESGNHSTPKDALTAAFLGELIADKLPFLPARTKPISLLARLISGATSAAKLDRDPDDKFRAALLGAAGALGATFLFYQLRKELSRRCDIPDYLLALGEDALLTGLALWILKQSEQSKLDLHDSTISM